MRDRTTKALLLAIALGLWANVALDWVRPVAVQASGSSQADQLRGIAFDLSNIANGTCVNQKIC